MTASAEIARNFKVEFDERRILRLIGYNKKHEMIKEPIHKLIIEEKRKLVNLLQPAAIYTIIDYSQTNKHPIFDHAEKVALCICIIGQKLEKEVQNLTQKNELLRALILDALGSEAVEEVAIQADRMLAEKAREMNLWPSKRFSPGYGKWDITQQRFIFNILPGQDIGVSLRESCMMVPQKSISFRINFYKEKKFSTRSQR
jgi:cobalamin-dependent methionine synthase I